MRRTRRPALVLLLAGLVSALALSVGAALLLVLDTRAETAQVVAERKVAGEPCIREHGVPSKGCDRLAKLLAETCTLRPGLCKETVTRALRSKDAKVRRSAAMALGAGLAAAGIRGSIQKPTVTTSTPPQRRREKTQAKTEGKAKTQTGGSKAPTATSAPEGAPAAKHPDSSPFPPQSHDSTPSRTISVPSLPVPDVPETPALPDVPPSVTVPEIPPEVPIVPPVTVPEVPIPPLPVPDPLPGAGASKHPACGIPVIHPCKPLK